MKMTVISLMLVTAMSLQSCISVSLNKDAVRPNVKVYNDTGKEILKGNKEIVKKTISVGTYNEVVSTGPMDIIFTQGKVGEITIEGDSNIVNMVEVMNSDNSLVLKLNSNKRITGISKLVVYVPINELKSLVSSGSGDIKSEKTIEGKETDVVLSGSGDVNLSLKATSVSGVVSGSGNLTLSGNSSNFDAVVSGSGEIIAYNLVADNVSAVISGSGEIYTTANKSLDAVVSGSGDVYYKGNVSSDDISVVKSGSGSVQRK